MQTISKLEATEMEWVTYQLHWQTTNYTWKVTDFISRFVTELHETTGPIVINSYTESWKLDLTTPTKHQKGIDQKEQLEKNITNYKTRRKVQSQIRWTPKQLTDLGTWHLIRY